MQPGFSGVLAQLCVIVALAAPALATAAPPTTLPAVPGMPATQPATPGANVDTAGPAVRNATSGFDLGGHIHSLFTARTGRWYFTPLDQMDPAHIHADMPMQIGQLDDMSLYMGLQTVGRFQALEQSDVYQNGMAVAGLDPGFQTPWGNLSFAASIPDTFEVYFDLYISSRPHSNQMYGHEGYMIFKQLPAPLDQNSTLSSVFDLIDVKVGAFDIDFGDQNYRRSNNARVQRNPLIGNYVIDPNGEEIGAEVYTTRGPVGGLIGIGSGTTTEHFDRGGGLSYHAKLWADVRPDLRASVSAYRVDFSGTGTGSSTGGDSSTLFSGNRSGGPYAAVFSGGDAPGQILPRAGKDMWAVQGDLTWNHWPWEAYTFVGWTQDEDINGSAAGTPAERWLYGGVEGVWHLTSAVYLAARYSYGLGRAVNDVSTHGWVDRIQVGGGYWLTRSILAKLEYVYEAYHDFPAAAGRVSGVDAFRSPSFNGAVVEVSFSF